MFRLKENGELKYYVIDEFEKTGLVKHCFTTRCGGVSENEYKSLNLRMHCDDKKENIYKNYQIICDEIDVNFENLVFSNQVHCDTIYTVGKDDLGNGITKPQKFDGADGADGLITNVPGVPLIVFGADCVPVFFLDVKKSVIALVHSGWKGTVLEISAKCVKKMVAEFGTNPEKVWETSFFGRSWDSMVQEGLNNKLMRMPQDAQEKVQQTLSRIINEGDGGMICILL